ncbi:lactococcin 972 family bacteriocin [Leuconostoc mesenteroides]|nr:lactococcin 972 family bacteriocin [Leuconostoc mesenteroides]
MNFKKVVLTTSALLAFAAPATVMAANVGGGVWNFGVGYTGTYGYSNYYHPSRSHMAQVENSGYYRSVRNSAGNWANVSITKIPPTGMNYSWGY